MKRQLVVGLSTAVATSIHLANAALTWKLSLVYHTDGRGRDTVTGTLYQDGETKVQNMKICTNGLHTYSYGNTGGQYWVDANVDLEGSYHDTVSGNVVTMFWTVYARLGQNAAANYIHDMVYAPTGYELVPKPDSPVCLLKGGTSVNPTSWTFVAWS